MRKAILGKKLGMTQIFTPEGLVVPVTVVEAGPCYVVQKKTQEKDGYSSIVLAFNKTRESLLNKPKLGVLKKANVQPSKILREFKFENSADYEIGGEIKADIFTEGDMVDVTGTTRGRGFSGTIVRWNASKLNMSHGAGPVHRHMGGTGAVYKNKKMPGQYGVEKVTIQNLQIVKVDADRNILLIKGCVPGPKGSYITVKEAVKG